MSHERVIVTGSRGTVGRALVARLERDGAVVVPWDRASVPIDDYHAMERFVRESCVDTIFHLAVASAPTGREGEGWAVSYAWTSELAWIARVLGVRFVFTSTAMVFSDAARGPFTLASEPDAPAGYGYEKRRAETRALEQYPASVVVRLGWQIGDGYEGNQMLAHFEREQREKGEVCASDRFLPACSFLDVTADALVRAAARPGGIVMLDQNEGWTFFQIARALAARHGDRWRIARTEDFAQDQRLRDPSLGLPPLSTRVALPPPIP